MDKALQKMVDKWYDDYCRKYKAFPTVKQVTEKVDEFKKLLDK